MTALTKRIREIVEMKETMWLLFSLGVFLFVILPFLNGMSSDSVRLYRYLFWAWGVFIVLIGIRSFFLVNSDGTSSGKGEK